MDTNRYLLSQIFLNTLNKDNYNLIQNYYLKFSEIGKVSPLERFTDNVFKTFQVDIEKLIEMKFIICKQLNQPWNLFDKLPFWEMEQMVDHLKKWIEKEKEEREKEEGKSKALYDKDKFMRDTQSTAKKYNIPTSGNSSSAFNKMQQGFKAPAGITPSSLKNLMK